MESFSKKSGMIQSGLKTMQITFVLEAELANDNTFELVVKAELVYERKLQIESLYHV